MINNNIFIVVILRTLRCQENGIYERTKRMDTSGTSLIGRSLLADFKHYTKQDNRWSQLELGNFGGIIWILLVGYGVSVFCAIAEILRHKV